MSNPAQERNQDATVYVGELSSLVTEELLWELFLQVGPVANVYIPRDKLTQQHSGYGFVEFKVAEDADYALLVLNMISVHGRPIRVSKASKDRETSDVGANVFVGGIDAEIDEKMLYDVFSAFGRIVVPPKVARDPESGHSKGYAFVKYDAYESSDAAIGGMNGQYLGGKQINCCYMFKKDSKERHGDETERQLAGLRRQHQQQNPQMIPQQPAVHSIFGVPIMPVHTPTPFVPPTQQPPSFLAPKDIRSTS